MPTPPDKQPHARRGREVASNPDLLPTASDIARFNRKIVYSPHCWFWTGAISTPDGYGRFTFQRDNQQRTMLAHRFALLAAGIDLAEGGVAEHACNEPLCVKVSADHVHRSTQSTNLRYAVGRGRHDGSRLVVQSHNRAARSLRIRSALTSGWNEEAYRAAVNGTEEEQLSLFSRSPED
ncbi:hypothetical protein [Corynebacterium mayonis]|uniref:hypothetical protein n=1 Tax=Corynebacterium mayonis TaxID=3062461 RepID=UPI0031401E1F